MHAFSGWTDGFVAALLLILSDSKLTTCARSNNLKKINYIVLVNAKRKLVRSDVILNKNKILPDKIIVIKTQMYASTF